MGRGRRKSSPSTPKKVLEQAPIIDEDWDVAGKSVTVEANKKNLTPPKVTKKFTKRVEKPFVRKVKVPIVKEEIVPDVVVKRVKITKMVEVPELEEVEEKYTVFEEVQKTRKKEIWVKKVIEEPYVEKVPRIKTRKVKRQVTKVRAVDEWVEVEIPTTKVEKKTVYRIDEIHDRKYVDVDEFREYELHPVETNNVHHGPEREATVPNWRPKRIIGKELLSEDELSKQRLHQLEEDTTRSAVKHMIGVDDDMEEEEEELPKTSPNSQRKRKRHDNGPKELLHGHLNV